ncbi:hypothetical protein BH09BAC1_BH09BAC1_23310 [soil metagenome]
MAPFEELQNRYCGERGSPERMEYQRRHKNDVNKLLLHHMVRRIKANVRKR